jgi:murein endopeptidase
LSYWIENKLVEYVFMDYALQQAMVRRLERSGVSRDKLRDWFQYPRGPEAAWGFIRHEPGHDDHLHVRFRCAPDDRHCD